MRSSLFIFVVLTFVLCLSLTAHSQNLEEAAKKERQRRDELKTRNRVYTNEDLEVYKLSEEPLPSGEPARARPLPVEGAELAVDPVSLENQEERAWSQRFSEARARLEETQDQEKRLRDRLNQLAIGCGPNSDYDPYYFLRIRQQLEDNQKLNMGARQALENLREELRKSGKPVSWESSQPAAYVSSSVAAQSQVAREKDQGYWQEQLALIDRRYETALMPLEAELFEMVHRRPPQPNDDLTVTGGLGICVPPFVVDLDTQIKTFKRNRDEEKAALVERALHEGALPGWFR